ncbi:hypothetical protein EMPS_05157 [Entomortierella parvispora]|uniref:Uncharacterized protein n=1 Tax=Entomortierella parvispora TaxID=205924 RepID=A0A9P3H9X7_9FUNG|nr:hypothetical protein EMPS_05157 [Entomortierella parvispora]
MSDEPWPARFQQEFARIPDNCDDKDWHPTWCAILSSVFSFDDGYMIAPQTYSEDGDAYGEGNPAYIIQNEEGVYVLGLEIRKASDMECMEKRQSAERDTRDRMRDCPSVPQFRMICAIGMHCAVFTKDSATGSITPASVRYHPGHDHEYAPQDWWNIDISTAEGRTALGAYFDEAKIMSSALPRNTFRGHATLPANSPVPWSPRLQMIMATLSSARSISAASWHPLYWALLASVFPVDKGYRIVPQIFPAAHWQYEYIEDVVVLVVENEGGIPTIGLEARRSRGGSFNNSNERALFDRDLRSRFRVLASPLPKFHLVSAIGTNCCVYTFDQAARSISPSKLPSKGPHPDSAPQSRWNIDLTTLEGKIALKSYLLDAKEMASSLFIKQ